MTMSANTKTIVVEITITNERLLEQDVMDKLVASGKTNAEAVEILHEDADGTRETGQTFFEPNNAIRSLFDLFNWNGCSVNVTSVQ
mgnify:FL=1